MHVLRFDDPAEFQHRVAPMLLEREAENCATLGLVAQLVPRPPADRTNPPLMLSVESAGRPVAAATLTPPYVLLLTRAPKEGAEALARTLLEWGVVPPGVQAPVGTVEAFAEVWTALSGQRSTVVMALGVHQLETLVPPPPSPGELRPARTADAELIDSWLEAFASEAGVERRGDAERRRHIETQTREGRLFVWCDGSGGPPLSAVAVVAPTPHGVRIGFVYTPPEHRRRGYASAAVAAVTQRQLQSGRRYCFLFTDLANPTSNRIYRALGYRHVCDHQKIMFGR